MNNLIINVSLKIAHGHALTVVCHHILYLVHAECYEPVILRTIWWNKRMSCKNSTDILGCAYRIRRGKQKTKRANAKWKRYLKLRKQTNEICPGNLSFHFLFIHICYIFSLLNIKIITIFFTNDSHCSCISSSLFYLLIH